MRFECENRMFARFYFRGRDHFGTDHISVDQSDDPISRLSAIPGCPDRSVKLGATNQKPSRKWRFRGRDT